MMRNKLILKLNFICVTFILVGLSGSFSHAKDWRKGLDSLSIFRSPWNSPEMARPLLTEDRIYVASSRGEIISFDKKTGERIDRFDIKAGTLATPAIENDRIYMGTDDGFFRCISLETGAEIWKYEFKGLGISEPVLSEKLVIFQTGRDITLALDKNTGEWVWTYPHDRREDLAVMGLSTPLIQNDRVYLGLSGGYVAALSIDTGRQIWKTRAFKAGRYNDVDARLATDEYAVYATSYAGETAAISVRSGMVYWNYPQGGLAKPCVYEDKVYIATMDEKVVCIDKMVGLKVWEKEIGTPSKAPLINIGFGSGSSKNTSDKNKKPGKRVKDKNWLIAAEILNENLVVQDKRGNLFFISLENGSIENKINISKSTSSPMAIEKNHHEVYIINNKGYLKKISAN